MEQDRLQTILKELYELDPSLRQHGDKLNVLIQKLLESEPEAEADNRFVAKLRHELMEHKSKKSFLFNIFNMKKIPFVATGVVMTIAIVLVASVSLVDIPKPKRLAQLTQNYFVDAPKTVELAANAFGKLGLTIQNTASRESALAPAPSAGLLGSEMAKSSFDASAPQVGFGGGAPVSGVATSVGATKMIAPGESMPYYNYQYNFAYTGEDFKITDIEMPVYRLSANENIAKAMGDLVLGTDLGFVDLYKFGNASVGSMSLSQGQGGYNIYINFDQGRISLDKNQAYPYVYADTATICNGPDCMRGGYPEKIYEQVPDAELIDAANKFLDKYSINKTVYGEPIVDVSWKLGYGDSNYVPPTQTIIYPVMFDDKISYDSGNYINGMRVNVNLSDMSVQSVNEIINPVFEKSNYELETDFNRILKVAQGGGFNGMFYGATQEGETLNLGTPKYVYLHQYDYSNSDGRVRELFIPALLFPMLDIPKDRYIYQTSIIVPIVKDFLDNYNNDGGGIMPRPLPMPYITSGEGVSEPGVVEGSAGSSAGSMEIQPTIQ